MNALCACAPVYAMNGTGAHQITADMTYADLADLSLALKGNRSLVSLLTLRAVTRVVSRALGALSEIIFRVKIKK